MAKRRLVLFLVTVLLISTVVLAKDLRVVGGKDVAPNSAPYIVSFQRNNIHYCAGSIINNNWVVTAAHCLTSKAQVLSTTVLAGSVNVNGKTSTKQIRSIDKYVVNDLYVGGTSPYDIGLVHTSKAFTWSNAVAPIALPASGSIPIGNALLYGWGSVSVTHQAIYPTQLQVATVPIIPQDSCEKALGDKGASVHSTNICTGPLTGGYGICSADSGGPLVQVINKKNVLTGIVSWGKLPCGEPNSPSVYVRLSALLSWIADNQ